MKQLLNNKWAWAVGLLLILNIITLCTVWLTTCNRHRHGKKHHHVKMFMEKRHHGAGRDFLAKKLGLSEEQKQAFDSLREQHFKQTDSNMAAIQVLRKKLIQHLGKQDAEVGSLIQQIAQSEAKVQENTFMHFSKLYEICTEEQKTVLKEELQNIVVRFGGGFKMHRKHDRPLHDNEEELPEPPAEERP